MKDRLKHISIIKGICIILMVIGHAGAPKYLDSWIYLFHMPCFFFISGYLLKESYFSSFKLLCIKKIKAIYWPFVKWSFIFLIFHNVLAYFHFYEDLYSYKDFLLNGIGIILFSESEDLLGGFWFLKELFFSTFISFGLIKISKYFNLERNRSLLLIIFLLVFCSYIFDSFGIRLPIANKKTFLATSYFMAGYLYRGLELNLKNEKYLSYGLGGYVLLAIIVIWFSYSMSNVSGINIIIYWAVSIIGSLSTFLIGHWCANRENKLAHFLRFSGDQTLYILTFHFLIFKFVNVFKIIIYDMPIQSISEFPIIHNNNEIFWMIYSFFGIAVPLFLVKNFTKHQ